MEMKPTFSADSPIVLIANGIFPTHSLPLGLLNKAKLIFAIDGGYTQATQHQIQPSYIFGDMDSTSIQKENFIGNWIELPDQNKTDLEKTLDWCIDHGVVHVILLGATGYREDMTLANHYILFDYVDKINITMVTDHFTITCHKGQKSFNSNPGETVSIIAHHSGTVISSTALKYPINQMILDPSARAISNQSIGSTFSIDASDSVIVFKSHTID
ncbi:MAG: thiamine diphosphokinase [Candidatus Marinimicrobia bacterium]|jgi:thiamine pyrophosphokinase|nr:thiamine diphosphokinase [Candidatus Neomarinimicrobiota bacterium]MBT4383852.1 thiamine diphosphokinase [Candidatus Neomarinimicrobiota bacterium]MBT5070150.1 thiamine diphosphokinase [Candidatus Neomarinimicrobiota bacterium]MBT6113028.1 thiamine diphosphokinase [Candidatus Neomarinimicrobiota bacterium]MBT6471724.1 thiamine diphosphokinase [Candidatus Neomarinimicrobiota bacterium]